MSGPPTFMPVAAARRLLLLARRCPSVQASSLPSRTQGLPISLAVRTMSTGPAAAAGAARAHTPPSSPSHGSPAAKKVKLDSDVDQAEEEALATSSTAGPIPAAAAEPKAATGKGKKAPAPRNAPAPGPRKVAINNGPRRVKRKPVDEVVLNEIKVRPDA
jgi:hypothetical protein